MKQLHFTTRVLGKKAAFRLEKHQITQTLRGYTDDMVQFILAGELILSSRIQVMLDKRMVGLAAYVYMDMTHLDILTIDDARRGGFDSISDLALALKRAGFRFKPIEQYKFYRIQFSWLS